VLLAPGYGGAFGVGIGYLVWLGLRQLTEREGLKFLRPVLGLVHVEHFALGCGVLGAVWLARRWWKRRPRAGSRTPQRAAPVTAAAAPAPVALPQSRPAAPAQPSQPTQPAQPTQVRRPQPVGSTPSRP